MIAVMLLLGIGPVTVNYAGDEFKLAASDAIAEDWFGHFVSISNDSLINLVW